MPPQATGLWRLAFVHYWRLLACDTLVPNVVIPVTVIPVPEFVATRGSMAP